jgi:hypothetical protein
MRKLSVRSMSHRNPKSKVIVSTTDPEGRTVNFSDGTWDHIKKDHPEMKQHGLTRLKSTVEKPEYITHNETRVSIIYSDFMSSYLYIHVITGIDTASDNVCNVRTSYLSPTLPKGDVIWARQSQKKSKRK